jgi:hypothetical protein
MRFARPVTPSSAPSATVTFCSVAISMFTAPPPGPRSTVPSSHEPVNIWRSPPSATTLPAVRIWLSVPPTSKGILIENLPPPGPLAIVPTFTTSGRFTLTRAAIDDADRAVVGDDSVDLDAVPGGAALDQPKVVDLGDVEHARTADARARTDEEPGLPIVFPFRASVAAPASSRRPSIAGSMSSVT